MKLSQKLLAIVMVGVLSLLSVGCAKDSMMNNDTMMDDQGSMQKMDDMKGMDTMKDKDRM